MFIFTDFDTLLFVLKVSFAYTQYIKTKLWKYIYQENMYQTHNQVFSDKMHFEVNFIQRDKEKYYTSVKWIDKDNTVSTNMYEPNNKAL